MTNTMAKMVLWKWALLVLLAIQNSALVVLISHYNRKDTAGRVHPSLMVCWVELFKLLLSMLIEIITNGSFTFKGESFASFSWLLVPAVLYAGQNNLCHLALKHLSPLIYQVLYQSKILTTAGFSVLILRKRLSVRQWTALGLLTAGLVFVQFRRSSDSSVHTGTETWKGLQALAFAAISSGLAGVFFEYNVKKSSHRRSLWLQNVILCCFALPISIILSMGHEEHQRYVPRDAMAWGLIMLQAVSGLLVAVIIKYLDNILKTFATGASIVLSALFSGASEFDLHFWLGTGLVLLSIYLYNTSSSTSNVIEDDASRVIRKKRIRRIESGR